MAYQKLQASRAIAVIPSDTVNIPNPATLAISSTTTGASALKLIDAAGDFVNKGVKIGDIVYSGTAIAATVTAVDSATQLSVSTAVGSGLAYKLYAAHETPNNGCVLYVGDVTTTGPNLALVTAGGDSVVLENLLAGVFIPIQTLRVNSTSTDAEKILALW